MAEIALAALLGACIGSFLNVCIVRLPEDRSIVFPGSHCVTCKAPILWYDNIPVLSYVLLRGRCRKCRTGISVVYPLVEIAAAALFVLFYVAFGLTPAAFVYLGLSLALLVETVIDLRYQIIPDEITLPGIVLGFLASTMWPGLHDTSVWWSGALASGLGIVAGGGFLYAAGTLAEKILKKEAMGGGDVKLLGFIGAVSEPGGPARVPAMVITPRRIITLKPLGSKKTSVAHFAPEDLKGLHRTENAAGHGSLWLRGTAGFELELIEWIRDVREVERLIRRTFGGLTDVDRDPKA